MPQFLLGQFFVPASTRSEGKSGDIRRQQLAIIQEEKKNLIDFRNRPNIEEIDEAISERRSFLQAFTEYSYLYGREGSDEELDKYFSPVLSEDLLQKAKECARAGEGSENDDVSLVGKRWAHWLLNSIVGIQPTAELQRDLEEIETYTVRG